MKKMPFLCVTIFLLIAMAMPAFAASQQAGKLYDPEAYPVVDKMEGEVFQGDIELLRYELCACGGRMVTRKVSETGFYKTGAQGTCEHGMAGMVWRNSITYQRSCMSCGTSTTYLTNVDEVRCAH